MCTAIATRLHSQELYRQGDIDGAVTGLIEAWHALPLPPEHHAFGAVIAGELAAIHLYDLSDCNGALDWTRVLARCSGPHASLRNVELMLGRIDIARGDAAGARTHLAAAFDPVPSGL
jgi:hypothetical protein